MGKRVASIPAMPPQTASPARSTIRKRKRISSSTTATSNRNQRQHATNEWHENDDEDSSSNDAPPARKISCKQANNSSIILNTSLNTSLNESSVNESPKPVYTLRPSVVNGTILYDLKQKPWRLGKPIGKGNFGEIFLASNNITIPVTNENAKFVVKIEPHSNGPLFVEIHCLLNTAKNNPCTGDAKPQPPPSGIPDYIASGSHLFGNARYRFLVLQRFDRDLHSLIKNCRVDQKSVLTLAIQIVNVLENLHDRGYCHNDVKAQNLMLSKCKFQQTKTASTLNGKGHATSGLTTKSKYVEHYEEKQPTTDSGNSSEQEANDDDENDEDFIMKRALYDDEDEDEDFDDGTSNSNSIDLYQTPVNSKNRKRRGRNTVVPYSGSNPVRACRRQERHEMYEEMVTKHYLRPTKRVSYSEFFNEDGVSVHGDANGVNSDESDDDCSSEFIPAPTHRSAPTNTIKRTSSPPRLTRRQEKMSKSSAGNHRHEQPRESIHEYVTVEEERIFLIDFGLASKFMDNGVHRPFIMDQRRAHDGTLEFTSRDAHMGAHSRRSDLECLGYNLIFWSQGYLPWKDAATQQQQEKVHQAKEYLMTDVREMLKQIYGKQVPRYLGDFLYHVGQLAYHERPNYARYRRIFEREFQLLGYSLEEMRLNSRMIARTCVKVKEEIENKNDIFEMNKHSKSWSITKNLSGGTPFHESTLSNRVSPKNLRSKSDKKSKKKRFSWAEILSQDPDQIARERAEKEFVREEEAEGVRRLEPRRYEGKPTYEILRIQERLKSEGRLAEEEEEEEEEEDDEEEQEDAEMEENEEEEEEGEDDECEASEATAESENDNEEDEEAEDDDDGEDEDNNEDENGDDDEDMETDAATEASEQSRTYARGRRAGRGTTKKSTKRIASRSSTATTATSERRSSRKRKPTAKALTSFITIGKTRKRKQTTTSISSSNNKINSKRGANSAATRDLRKANVRENGHNSNSNNNHNMYNSGSEQHGIGRPTERRTRRCLIKTEAESEDEEESIDEGSNSNFTPDARGIFNVWKKTNNERLYFRGSSSAAARHYKK